MKHLKKMISKLPVEVLITLVLAGIKIFDKSFNNKDKMIYLYINMYINSIKTL